MWDFHIDVFTLVLMIITGNLVVLILLLSYASPGKADVCDKAYLTSKILLVIGWSLLDSRGHIPVFLSFDIGNVFNILGAALEALSFIYLREGLKRKYLIGAATALIFVVMFWLVGIGLVPQEIRILIYTIVMVAFYLWAGILFFRPKPSHTMFDKVMGGSFLAFFAILTYRMSMILLSGQYDLFQPQTYQVGTYMVYLVFVIITGMGYVLLKKQAVDVKAALSDRLLKLDKMKDEFLANTSHELKTPLNGIINIAAGMLKTSNDGEQNLNLHMIVANGRHLANLVNDILDYSMLKNKEIILNLEPVDLKKMVDKNFLVFKHIKSNLELINEIPADVFAYADEERLNQILFNLVGNAVKFTHNGKITATARILGDKAEIGIHDSGIGIPSEKQGDIFLSFEQADTSITRSYGGTGLGLSITKSLVQLHGGEIWVESEEEKGASFFFTLPLFLHKEAVGLTVTENKNPGREPVTIPSGFPTKVVQKGPHILVVDDDTTSLYTALTLLKQEGYSVSAVSTGKEALNAIQNNMTLALVVIDVMMPDISGFELCREIRKRYSAFELPVLMLTARNATPDIVIGMDAGANDYITKPYQMEEFLARVRTLINLKASVDKAMAAELAFLQAQIKPHFLYNALNTFIAISRQDGEKARKLISDFGNYLRRNFDFENYSQQVPLRFELELVTAYLEIEKARFGPRIEITWEMPEHLEAKLPPLVLQPIVENAVNHGIMPQKEGGKIEIAISLTEHELMIKVKDNGVGMDPIKAKLILTQESSGIGIYNIEKRLQRLYGKGLEIKSRPGKGTEVTIRIPRLSENDDKREMSNL